MTDQFNLGFNERRILSALRSGGPASRAALARRLDITPSTVTRLTSGLMDGGLLSEEEDPERAGQKGFPARLLRLQPEGICSAGVYLDPDRIMTCVANLAGELLAEEEVQVPDRSFGAIMTEAAASVHRLIERAGVARDRMAGCGVSYPGQYSTDPDHVLRIRQFNDWPDVDVRRDLSPYFGMAVQHMNDAKAACLAELYHGAARELRNFCHVWLSYGIGGAAVVEQRPYLGRNNLAAEWGGLFPKSQPRPSGQDLLDTLMRAGLPFERLSDVRAEHLGLPPVQEWRDRAAEQLRWLCLVIARTYAPEAIVIGGTLPDALIQVFIDHVSDAGPLGEDYHVAPPRILRASRDHLPQLGAAALPVHSITNPVAYLGQARKGW